MISLKKAWSQQVSEYQKAGIVLPKVAADKKKADTQWIHFGGGNLYRGFHAATAQDLLDLGKLNSGVVVCETYDEAVIDQAYQPYNNQFLQVVMHEDGTLDNRLLASTAESYYCNPTRPESFNAVKHIFEQDSLQLATFTITEKGYSLKDSAGKFFPIVEADLTNGPDFPQNTMSIVASLLLARFNAGQLPIAMVSTDNFSHNGKKFQEAVLTIAQGWVDNHFAPSAFLDYLKDDKKVSFPWSMIDRITPNPAESVVEKLEALGVVDAQIIHTEKHTNIAPFANTEVIHYLVIEDSFPNGQPDLAAAGVILTDRATVDKADAMKVTTCLNPLHTALAVFGCLLDYTAISAEMTDPELVGLIKQIGYHEGLPVVDDPKIINPQNFIDELIEKRLPNPNIPDAPQRIASDTSQKVAIRYGETIRKYVESSTLDASDLTFIPLTIAGWLRYLLAVDDNGESFTPSPDPLLSELQEKLAPLHLGFDGDVHPIVKDILSNETIFSLNLYQAGLGEKIEGFLLEMLQGPGSIRATLQKYLAKGVL
ncbi:mannitol dehydrogenase family protein [Enterococcus timonensis]|uniref:mannitol dehydrogenase family protein n=1 Tax=Enterococcus timonensis TaxID=1852364 RepID=UPI0008D91E7D|nr:mannitol dehydrogenase family protein [Enterococcus timonensis]